MFKSSVLRLLRKVKLFIPLIIITISAPANLKGFPLEHHPFRFDKRLTREFCYSDFDHKYSCELAHSLNGNKRTLIPSYAKSRDDFSLPNYLIISISQLNITGVNFTYGFYPALIFKELTDAISFTFSYQFSRQDYASNYMKTPKSKEQVTFHAFGIGLAGDITGNLSSQLAFVFTPRFETGIELPQINTLLFDQKIEGMRTWYYKPGIQTAILYDRYGLGVGLNYYFYESYVRELNSNILIDNLSNNPVSYSRDLFPGRDGLQLNISFIFKF